MNPTEEIESSARGPSDTPMGRNRNAQRQERKTWVMASTTR